MLGCAPRVHLTTLLPPGSWGCSRPVWDAHARTLWGGGAGLLATDRDQVGGPLVTGVQGPLLGCCHAGIWQTSTWWLEWGQGDPAAHLLDPGGLWQTTRPVLKSGSPECHPDSLTQPSELAKVLWLASLGGEAANIEVSIKFCLGAEATESPYSSAHLPPHIVVQHQTFKKSFAKCQSNPPATFCFEGSVCLIFSVAWSLLLWINKWKVQTEGEG